MAVPTALAWAHNNLYPNTPAALAENRNLAPIVRSSGNKIYILLITSLIIDAINCIGFIAISNIGPIAENNGTNAPPTVATILLNILPISVTCPAISCPLINSSVFCFNWSSFIFVKSNPAETAASASFNSCPLK